MRLHDAASAASGRVIAPRTSIASTTAIRKNVATMAISTRSRQSRTASSSAIPAVRAVSRCWFCTSKSSRMPSNSVLPRSTVAPSTTPGAPGLMLAMSGSA